MTKQAASSPSGGGWRPQTHLRVQVLIMSAVVVCLLVWVGPVRVAAGDLLAVSAFDDDDHHEAHTLALDAEPESSGRVPVVVRLPAKDFLEVMARPVPATYDQTPDEELSPLASYFVASSHNSYVTGAQTRRHAAFEFFRKGERGVAVSSARVYEALVLSGCRVLEMDVWPASQLAPVADSPLSAGHIPPAVPFGGVSGEVLGRMDTTAEAAWPVQAHMPAISHSLAKDKDLIDPIPFDTAVYRTALGQARARRVPRSPYLPPGIEVTPVIISMEMHVKSDAELETLARTVVAYFGWRLLPHSNFENSAVLLETLEELWPGYKKREQAGAEMEACGRLISLRKGVVSLTTDELMDAVKWCNAGLTAGVLLNVMSLKSLRGLIMLKGEFHKFGNFPQIVAIGKPACSKTFKAFLEKVDSVSARKVAIERVQSLENIRAVGSEYSFLDIELPPPPPAQKERVDPNQEVNSELKNVCSVITPGDAVSALEKTVRASDGAAVRKVPETTCLSVSNLQTVTRAHTDYTLTRLWDAWWAYTSTQLLRIYPSLEKAVGGEAESGSVNYDPLPEYNQGAQLVALNWQTKGAAMDTMLGLFVNTEGYLLKPKHMLAIHPGDRTIPADTPGEGVPVRSPAEYNLKTFSVRFLIRPTYRFETFDRSRYVTVSVERPVGLSTSVSQETVLKAVKTPESWETNVDITIGRTRVCVVVIKVHLDVKWHQMANGEETTAYAAIRCDVLFDGLAMVRDGDAEDLTFYVRKQWSVVSGRYGRSDVAFTAPYSFYGWTLPSTPDQDLYTVTVTRAT